MKCRVYMRVARKRHVTRGVGIKAAASALKTQQGLPLEGTPGNPMPTVAFALDLDIPDDAFRKGELAIAEIMIPEDQLEIAAEVKQ